MIITGAHLSTGGKEVLLYTENGEKYTLSAADAKKTGFYDCAEDDALLPLAADDDMIVFLASKMRCVKYAVYLLEFGDKTRKALLQKMKTKGYEEDVCLAALAVLEKNGLIDDEALCARKLETLARTKFYGPRRIKGELIAKGFTSSQAQNALDEAAIDFDELLETLVEKLTRRGAPQDDKACMALKNKLIRYGYSYDSVAEILNRLKTAEE